MTRIVGAGLLASAFAPLVGLLAVLRLDELGWVAWALLVASVGSILLLGAVLRSLAGIQPRPVVCVRVRRADERVLAFTSSYVVPVVVAVFGGAGPAASAATAGMVGLLALIYVRAGLYHLNPTLAVAGYRLYELTTSHGTVTMLLTRGRHIAQQAQLECRYLDDDVAIHLRAAP